MGLEGKKIIYPHFGNGWWWTEKVNDKLLSKQSIFCPTFKLSIFCFIRRYIYIFEDVGLHKYFLPFNPILDAFSSIIYFRNS